MAEFARMANRTLEAIFLAVMGIAVLIGGRSLVVAIASFRGLAIVVLAILAVLIIYAFRQNYRRGGPGVRLSAARDAAFLAAIIAGIAFVASPARWSLGAAVVGLEVGIVVEFLARVVTAPQRDTNA